MESKLTKLSKELNQKDYAFLSKKSMDWINLKIKSSKVPGAKIASSIARESERHHRQNELLVGDICFFYYDPKYADDLPYYDIFPLTIILEKKNDGILGLNLHYLPIVVRAAFMDKLMKFSYGENEKERIKVTYDILSATTKYKEFRPCIKRYLTKQMKSNFLKVNPDEWETALFLPVQQFQKASQQKVWKESLISIQGK